MKQTTVFVTGANGFIGRAVVSRLARTYRVVALLRPGSIPGFALHPNITIAWGDLTQPATLQTALPANSVIVNLAANPYHPTLSRLVNVEGVRSLLKLAAHRHARRFIHISSQATKIKRQGVYARTKNEADRLVADSGLCYTILKPSLVYGPGERGLFARVGKLMARLPWVPIFGDGQTKVYPIHVEDVAEAVCLAAADTSRESLTFDLGSHRPVSYRDIYRAIAGTRPVHFVSIPVWAGLLLARMMQFLPNPPISVDNVLGSTQAISCRSRAICTRYGLRIRPFDTHWRDDAQRARVRVAVVGLGKMGTLHISLLCHMPDVEIVALVDTNPKLYQTIHSMGVPGTFYPTLTAALAQEQLDAVYLITPTFTHVPLIQEALAAGLHVFVEKPVALNARELQTLAALPKQRVVHVGYTMLYVPIIRELGTILKSGMMGEITRVRATFAHGEVFGPKKGWMFNPKLSGGGVLMNPGPHLFSMIAYLFGGPKQLTSQIRELYQPGLDDEVQAELEYERFRLTAQLSWSVRGKDVGETKLEIHTRRGWIKTDGHTLVVKRGTTRRTVTEAELLAPSVFELNPAAYGSAYYLESRAFIEAVQGKRVAAPNTLKQAIQIEKIMHAIYTAGRSRS